MGGSLYIICCRNVNVCVCAWIVGNVNRMEENGMTDACYSGIYEICYAVNGFLART